MKDEKNTNGVGKLELLTNCAINWVDVGFLPINYH